MYSAWNTTIIMMLIMLPDVMGKDFFVTTVKCNILFSCFYLFYYLFLLIYAVSKKNAFQYKV